MGVATRLTRSFMKVSSATNYPDRKTTITLLKSLRNAALAVMLLSTGAANAALYNFNLTGDYTASWQLDSAATPDAQAVGQGFVFYDVEGNFPDSLFDLADLTFYNATLVAAWKSTTATTILTCC
jgi:hypothetical protein